MWFPGSQAWPIHQNAQVISLPTVSVSSKSVLLVLVRSPGSASAWLRVGGKIGVLNLPAVEKEIDNDSCRQRRQRRQHRRCRLHVHCRRLRRRRRRSAAPNSAVEAETTNLTSPLSLPIPVGRGRRNDLPHDESSFLSSLPPSLPSLAFSPHFLPLPASVPVYLV